ncbi:MAG TPA: hypothetical protein VGX23_01230 [Actinocrinis sp.]|nr:hypothetical protein [Actinocrinis sp.]
MTRLNLRLLLPFAFVFAIVLVAAGLPEALGRFRPRPPGPAIRVAAGRGR